MKICSCGYMNPDENRLCTICGKNLEETTPEQQNNVTQSGFVNNANTNDNNANPTAYDNSNSYNDGYNQNNGNYNNGFNAGYNPNYNSNGYNAGYNPNAETTSFTVSNQNAGYNTDTARYNQNVGYNQNTAEYNTNDYNNNPQNMGYNPNATYNPNPINGNPAAYMGYVPYRFSPEPVHNDKAAVLYRSTMTSAAKSTLMLIAGILLIISGIFSFMALSMPLPIILGIGILVLRKTNADNPQSINAGTMWIKVHNIINLVLMIIAVVACLIFILASSVVLSSPEVLKDYTQAAIDFIKSLNGWFWCLTVNSIASGIMSIIGLSVMGNLKNAFNYGRKRCKSLNVYAIACFITALLSIITLVICLAGFDGLYDALYRISLEDPEPLEPQLLNVVIFAFLPVITYVAALVLFGFGLLKIQRANDNFTVPADEYDNNGINTADGNIINNAHDNAFTANNGSFTN